MREDASFKVPLPRRRFESLAETAALWRRPLALRDSGILGCPQVKSVLAPDPLFVRPGERGIDTSPGITVGSGAPAYRQDGRQQNDQQSCLHRSMSSAFSFVMAFASSTRIPLSFSVAVLSPHRPRAATACVRWTRLGRPRVRTYRSPGGPTPAGRTRCALIRSPGSRELRLLRNKGLLDHPGDLDESRSLRTEVSVKSRLAFDSPGLASADSRFELRAAKP